MVARQSIMFLAMLPAAMGWVPPLTASHRFLGIDNRPSSMRRNAMEESSSEEEHRPMGLNELQTLLRQAVQNQDYAGAGRFSDQIYNILYGSDSNDTKEERRLKRRKMSWRGLGAAPWLVDRLDSLNLTFPTTIQINAMESVNAILGSNNTLLYSQEMVESMSLEERVDKNNVDMGIVVSGTTGAGKTLAYLVPLLSTLSDSLFLRQRIRVGWEENVGDTMGDLMERIAVVTSPVVRSKARKQVRQKGAIATGASMSSLGSSGTDIKAPLALIVVPGRELGVQTALLAYQLVGGNIKERETQMPGKENSFKYKGPKGIRIGCVLDDEEAEFGLKLQTDIAITTPQYLGKLIDDGDINPSMLRVVTFDEADSVLEETDSSDLTNLLDDDPEMRDYSRLTFLVGASVTESLGNLAVSNRILPDGKSYIASATRFAPLDSQYTNGARQADDAKASSIVGQEPKMASLKDLAVCLDPGLKHERVIIRQDKEGLLALTRLLRKELSDYEAKAAVDPTIQRPRVVVFFPDEAQAKDAIEPLRDAVWGEHRLCVLLPKTGLRPLSIMEQFKKGDTSVMLATPNSVRGLDFPALTHVYTFYVPVDDPREYVHLAGRVGRIGQTGSVQGGGGRVISILREGDEAEAMEGMAKTLGFDFVDMEAVEEEVVRLEDGNVDLEETGVDELRRYLEDTLNLVGVTEDDEDEAMSGENSFIDAEIEDEDDQDDDQDMINESSGVFE